MVPLPHAGSQRSIALHDARGKLGSQRVAQSQGMYYIESTSGVWNRFHRCLHTIMSTAVLGIDIGTGGTRALLTGRDGQILASATAEHAPFVSKQGAWAEQDPQDWWRACQQAIRRVIASSGIAPRQIACVGLSGQMHGTVVLDVAGSVLRPAIIWCDQRGEEDARWLEESVGADKLLNITSNPALTNFTLVKLLWLRR